jgi:uncharacterized protein YjbI with pentapeptide repeats
VNLREAKLRRADLMSADLRGADLRGANLNRADLVDADLRRTSLMSANLQGANLYLADLYGANLRSADLRSANLTGAKAGGTNFADLDLSAAVALATIEHSSPSTVGIDTIYKWRGKIPEVFLRGCGVPEEFIAYIESMVGRPIEYYSCFISYSTKDQAFADRLYADLQAKGGRFMSRLMKPSGCMTSYCSFFRSTAWRAIGWGTEIANAREREAREKKQMLFPITIAPFEEVKKWKKFDADRGTDSGGRFGSITFQTSAGGSATMPGINGSLRSWSAR